MENVVEIFVSGRHWEEEAAAAAPASKAGRVHIRVYTVYTHVKCSCVCVCVCGHLRVFAIVRCIEWVRANSITLYAATTVVRRRRRRAQFPFIRRTQRNQHADSYPSRGTEYAAATVNISIIVIIVVIITDVTIARWKPFGLTYLVQSLRRHPLFRWVRKVSFLKFVSLTIRKNLNDNDIL